MSVKVARSLIAILLMPIVIVAVAAPAQAAPPQARSWYITSYSPSWAFDRGCSLGEQDLGDAGTQTHYVVLDFGAMYDAGSDFKFTAFSGPDMTMTQAKDMIYEYGRGYFLCTGSDTSSQLFIASGTNNSGGDITYAAGARLAVLARSAGNQIANAGYDGQVHPIGASDFESWGAGSSRATASRNWIDGYNDTSQRPLFVNYGSADGCPSASVPSANSCNAGLPAESIWYVSWQGAAYPLPEIYAESGVNAKQWRYLSRYAQANHNSQFIFKGIMVQRGACSQFGPCPGTENGPGEGWQQLKDQIDLDSQLSGSPGPPTDIWWH